MKIEDHWGELHCKNRKDPKQNKTSIQSVFRSFLLSVIENKKESACTAILTLRICGDPCASCPN